MYRWTIILLVAGMLAWHPVQVEAALVMSKEKAAVRIEGSSMSGGCLDLWADGRMGQFPIGSLCAVDQPAAPAQGVVVKPVDWLKAQTPPDFAPNSTLPPHTRWGWAMSFDIAKELADRWGYAVEFAGYVSEKVADEARANPNGRNGRCLTLVAGNHQKYKLGVLLDRRFPTDMPPEAYVRDVQGNFIPDKWNPKSPSPEMPEHCLKQAGELSTAGLAKLHARCPIAIIQNGGEYGLNVLGWVQRYWEKDPKVVAAKGDMSWYEYVSRQKAREQSAVADAVRAATPDRLLYVFYTCGGDTHRHGTRETFHDDWAWDYSDMQACADTLQARAIGRVYTATLQDGKPVLQQVDAGRCIIADGRFLAH